MTDKEYNILFNYLDRQHQKDGLLIVDNVVPLLEEWSFVKGKNQVELCSSKSSNAMHHQKMFYSSKIFSTVSSFL